MSWWAFDSTFATKYLDNRGLTNLIELSIHSSFLNDVGVVLVYARRYVFELGNLVQGFLLLLVAVLSAQLLELQDTIAIVTLEDWACSSVAPGRLFALEHFLYLKDVYVLFDLLQLSNWAEVVVDDGPNWSLYTWANAISDIVAGHSLMIAPTLWCILVCNR